MVGYISEIVFFALTKTINDVCIFKVSTDLPFIHIIITGVDYLDWVTTELITDEIL